MTEAQSPEAARPPTILIVDDEPFNIAVLEQELEDLGYATVSAPNGLAALALVARTPPDLILLDIMMPGLDGFGVLERLKADPLTRDIPVVVISALTDLPSIVRGIAQGAVDYLPKPFEPTLLRARVIASLAQKRLRDQERDYLHQVERLAAAAVAVEQGDLALGEIEAVIGRTDALGQLARVFQRMAREVHAREQRLRRQLAQLRQDHEEQRQATIETAASYIPLDRRRALAGGQPLQPSGPGTVLFADLAGFTPLTEALTQELGYQRGAEELTRLLNQIYAALLDALHRYGGCAVALSGDALTCWFAGDDGRRATASALAMQAAVSELPLFTTTSATAHTVSLKVAVASGVAHRWLIGDPAIQQIEVLAGAPVTLAAEGERHAHPGEVMVSAAVVDACGAQLVLGDWRADQSGNRAWASVTAFHSPVDEAPWPEPAPLPNEVARSWVLPAVYAHVQSGTSAFLADLRPVAALFVRFAGAEGRADPETLDHFVRRVQRVISQHGGAVLQVVLGDKGSYLYASFGAPVAHEDDAARAVAAALQLIDLQEGQEAVAVRQMGLTLGTARAGAYGGATWRNYSVLGDPVNLAARLMQAAAPILCDERIALAARDHWRFLPLPPLVVKGKAGAVAVFQPIGPSTALGPTLDMLPPTHLLALKMASVIAHPFAPALLTALEPEVLSPVAVAVLDDLIARRLVSRQSDKPEEQYVLDAAIQRAVYERMLFAQRRQLHRAVAAWYERQHAHELDRYAARLAHHWERAEDPVRAQHYWELAATWAERIGSHEDVRHYIRLALTIDPRAP